MKTETLVNRLAEQGQRRATAKAEAEAAMLEIRRLARAAHKAGARKTEIARAAQISRPALDEFLRD